MESTDLTLKKSPKVACLNCNYICSKQCDMDKHLLTSKHRKKQKEYEKSTEKSSSPVFNCKCGKMYKFRAGLWKHQKTCELKNLSIANSDKELIMMLIKENNDIKKTMLEVCSPSITNINSNNVVNNFNLQFFLNETCKDALNLSDFVNSIQLQLADLESVGEIGYVNGITNIIVKHLKALDVNKRPLHCSDQKREIVYVKEENKWEKDEEKKKLKKAITKISNKNISMIPEWKDKHPDCIHSESNKSDQYNYIIMESIKDTEIRNAEKIISNIIKEIKIDREKL